MAMERSMATARNIKDFKVFPGTNPDTTPEEVAEEINKALAQIEAGEAEEVLFTA